MIWASSISIYHVAVWYQLSAVRAHTTTTYLISLIASYLFSKECLQWDIQMLDTQFEACDLQWPLQAKSDEHVVALQI